MSPDATIMSAQAIKKIQQLVKDGATIIIGDRPSKAPGLADDKTVKAISNELLSSNGKIYKGAFTKPDLNELGITKDLIVTDVTGNYAKDIAWNHRAGEGFDSYFISNQHNEERIITLSLRTAGKVPELWDALIWEMRTAGNWKIENGRTVLTLKLEANGSIFVVLKQPAKIAVAQKQNNWPSIKLVQQLQENWWVKFDPRFGGPNEPVQFTALQDWSKSLINDIKYYSGTATYTQSIDWRGENPANSIWLDLGTVNNLAEVYVNGRECGTAWTYPYRVDISKALKPGKNEIKIEVSNTWANRLIGDHDLPEDKRTTWTNAVYRLDNKPLLPAGLMGPIKIIELRY